MLFLKLSKGKSAVFIDVRTDMFDPVKDEFTLNETAIQKQEDFIKAIHDKLISNTGTPCSFHLTTFEHFKFLYDEPS